MTPVLAAAMGVKSLTNALNQLALDGAEQARTGDTEGLARTLREIATRAHGLHFTADGAAAGVEGLARAEQALEMARRGEYAVAA